MQETTISQLTQNLKSSKFSKIANELFEEKNDHFECFQLIDNTVVVL